MSAIQQTTDSQQITLHFFDFLFGQQKGFLCLATASPDKSKTSFKQDFFEWPDEKLNIARFVEKQTKTKNIWFCVNLLSQQIRQKEYCLPSAFAWADLDYIIPTQNGGSPGEVPYPSLVVESSPARFQAYWKIEDGPVPPDVAEDFSHKIAYSMGADKSGWDLTQLLRIPWTNNWKYTPEVQVKILAVEDYVYASSIFDKIEIQTPDAIDVVASEIPDDLPDVQDVVTRFQSEGKLTADFAELYAIEPDANVDWSARLWRLIHECFRMGMTRDEVFVVASDAKCNKYKRDNRPFTYLWREVVKASGEHQQFEALISTGYEIVKMPHLVDWDEFEEDAFIKDYKTWANQATDAPEQYHELSCFITLSSILSAGLYVRTSHTPRGISPNLWGLVLGESTLTRKTTAMRIATDMLDAIDPELVVATDGSVEGLFSSISHRPKRVSMFVRDEVSGFFDSLKKKDYLAGMREALTQLYDNPTILRRQLRKETITISEPYFIFFGGGIRDKVYSIIDDEWILSGFMPRFLIVAGENDLSRLRRTGPPTELSTERRDNLIVHLADMKDRFTNTVESTIAGQVVTMPVRTEAKLTQDAWDYYGEIESKLVEAGHKSDIDTVALPTLTRLSGHLLKMSLLIAASRRHPDSANRLMIELTDVKQAAFYIERWGYYSIDLIVNAGKSDSEKLISKALYRISREEGITRTKLSRSLHLDARPMKDLIDTMAMRGLIVVKQSGSGQRYYSTGIGG